MARKSAARCTCRCHRLASEPLTYSLAEAAQRIGGVSARALADEFRAGRLEGRKFGRQWRMTEEDIQSYIEQRRVRPQEQDSAPATCANDAVTPPQRPRKPKKPASSGDDQISLFG